MDLPPVRWTEGSSSRKRALRPSSNANVAIRLQRSNPAPSMSRIWTVRRMRIVHCKLMQYGKRRTTVGSMDTLSTSEAAAVLHVSPNTLRGWEGRFGYPAPCRTPSGRRRYRRSDIVGLSGLLRDGLSTETAIMRARAERSVGVSALVAALATGEISRADAAMDAAVVNMTLTCAVVEVLLPALATIARRHGERSALWALTIGWARDWLARAKRFSSLTPTGWSVVFGTGLDSELGQTAPRVLVLELLVQLEGLRVLSTPVTHFEGIADVVRGFAPIACLVVAGTRVDRDGLGHWAYQVRRVVDGVPIVFFDPPSAGLMRRRAVLSGDIHAAAQQIRALASVAILTPLKAAVLASVNLPSDRRGWRTTAVLSQPEAGA